MKSFLFPGRLLLCAFPRSNFSVWGEKKRCQFHFQTPLFVFLLTRCGNWDRKQTVGLGFYFLFKCSHCLRQNCDFPLLAALYKAHPPWCPPQMAVQAISFLKALSRVLFLGGGVRIHYLGDHLPGCCEFGEKPASFKKERGHSGGSSLDVCFPPHKRHIQKFWWKVRPERDADAPQRCRSLSCLTDFTVCWSPTQTQRCSCCFSWMTHFRPKTGANLATSLRAFGRKINPPKNFKARPLIVTSEHTSWISSHRLRCKVINALERDLNSTASNVHIYFL